MSDENHSLALAFDTDDPEFCRGVELGKLYETLRLRPGECIEQTIHATNAEMALRLGESLGREVTGRELDDHWLAVTYEPQV